MAKHLIFGATYNGDGTTSSEAASNGAAGAWNQASILTGTAPTYGSLAAGDVVNIRSKTGAGADADISNTLGGSISLGNSAGTATAPITWILDDGTIWSGKNGTLTYTTSSGTYAYTVLAGNRLFARTAKNWILENTAATPPSTAFTINGIIDGVKINLPNRTSVSNCSCIFAHPGPHRDNYVYALRTASTANGGLIQATGGITRHVNLQVEIGSNANGGAVFSSVGSNLGVIDMRGGKLFGAGATTGTYLAKSDASTRYFELTGFGFQVPKTVTPLYQASASSIVDLVGLDGGSGACYSSYWADADCRNITNNYPTLNGTLADSAGTAASWRLAPTANTNIGCPAQITISKKWTSAAATKTITLAFLLATGWTGTACDASSIYMEVCYTDDTTGEIKRLTTWDPAAGALTADGSSSWLPALSWGVVSFDRKKLSVTTPTSIKQDSDIICTFYCTASGAGGISANEQIIIDADVTLS